MAAVGNFEVISDITNVESVVKQKVLHKNKTKKKYNNNNSNNSFIGMEIYAKRKYAL
jgi:hypothetical protein